jgi:chromosome segregation ATPase
MESASKPTLTPKERIELIRAELESIKASTNQRKWEMLNMEMQDIRDDLSDEIQTGLKDAANLMGDLGKRLCKLEHQVEELTKALSKISEATAEASSKVG